MDSILKSFEINDTLCPDIWLNVDSADYTDITLKPEIRVSLLHATNTFIDYIGVDVFETIDVIITGSISNFNWSEFSDVDLHVLIDKEKMEYDEDILTNLFNSKKSLFNKKIEDVAIKGHDLELYVQDIADEHHSSGVFSILSNKWLVEPKRENFDINTKSVDNKKNAFTKVIDRLVSDFENTEYNTEEMQERIQILKDKIKKYRQSGLTRAGESSDENIVFKYLRRSGHLEKISDVNNKLLNNILTVETQKV